MSPDLGRGPPHRLRGGAERGGERGRALPLAVEGARDQQLGVFGHVAAGRAERHRVIAGGRLPGQHLVEHPAEAADVAGGVGGGAGGPEGASDAEVGESCALGTEQHVFRTHVAVDETLRVRGGEGLRQLGAVAERLGHGQQTLALEPGAEALAIGPGDDIVEGRGAGAELERGDVQHRQCEGVAEAAGGEHLAHEPLGVGPGGELRQEDLHHHRVAAVHGMREPGGGGAAGGEGPLEPVARPEGRAQLEDGVGAAGGVEVGGHSSTIRTPSPASVTVCRADCRLSDRRPGRALSPCARTSDCRGYVGERYRIERELGHGGMATVYLAEDLREGRQVAVKVLRREITGIFGSGRFAREIRILERLRHPAIVPVLDSHESPGLHYFVMPYVAGESLRELLVREGPLPLARVHGIAEAVASALDYAHSQEVLHRDIKPANILLQGGRVVVCDFGVARAVEIAAGDTISSSGLVLGTPAYMSPEQAMGSDIDERTDVYALGCVLYEMLAGEPAFTGATSQAVVAKLVSEEPRPLRGVRPDLPPATERAIRAALAKQPEARPRSAGELVARLA